jgi:hypothetical protein
MSDADLTRLLAVVGTFTGTMGLLIGWLNYRRDRTSVKVKLQRNVVPVGMGVPQGVQWGNIVVSNSGRRPVFIGSVDLLLDTGMTALMMKFSSMQIDEGGQPATHLFDLGETLLSGSIICVRAHDGAGRTHYSRMSFKQRLQLRFFHRLKPPPTS